MNSITTKIRPSDYAIRRAEWFQSVAESRSRRRGVASSYRRFLTQLVRRLVLPGQRVLDVSAGNGDLLKSVAPDYGLGIELSAELCEEARLRYPGMQFIQGALEEVDIHGTFDYVIATDTTLDCFDVDVFLGKLKIACHSRTRLILTNYSQVWRPLLKLCRWLRLAKPRFGKTWFSPQDMRNSLRLAGFELVREMNETLLPIQIPLLTQFSNRILARLPFFRALCLYHVYIARKEPSPMIPSPRVSVIVPARNEAGNIERILAEIPQMGSGTEIIFVEGNSTDDTWEVLQRMVAERQDPNILLLKQPGRGKGDAVRTGFAAAGGDILMILDADLTVPAETLPRFYEAIASGKAEFANGTRLVYAMDDRAMQFLNLLANYFFAQAFTFVLGQPVRDTLCGTKVMLRKTYEQLAAHRSYFGDFDPFGDFDLLFGAARLNLKIVDIPIRYRERVYGSTNISRFRHGLLLFKMLFLAANKLKFV